MRIIVRNITIMIHFIGIVEYITIMIHVIFVKIVKKILKKNSIEQIKNSI